MPALSRLLPCVALAATLAACGGTAATTSTSTSAATLPPGAAHQLPGSGYDPGSGGTSSSFSTSSAGPVSVSPSPLAFGTVALRTEAFATATVKNGGASNMYVTAVSFSGIQTGSGFSPVYSGSSCWSAFNNYSAGNTQAFVGPGATCTFTFSFTPTASGSWTSSFSFKTSYSSTSSTTVQLTASS